MPEELSGADIKATGWKEKSIEDAGDGFKVDEPF